MKLDCNDNIDIIALQKAFNKMFPYLSLIVNKQIRTYNNKISLTERDIKMKLEICRSRQNKLSLEFHPEITVSDLMECFKKQFGLLVTIKRKSGKAWLNTTVTRNWTLREQNEQGKALSLPAKK